MASELAPADPEGLWAEYRLTRGLDERNALAEHYLYLARRIARRFSGRGVEYDDLLQVASLALIGALERFDHERNERFAAFAAPTMAGAVRNYFRDKAGVLRLSRGHFEMYGRMLSARGALAARFGREPSVLEIALELDITEDTALDIIESRRAVSAISLDAPAAEPEDGGPAPLGSVVGAEEPGYNRVEDRDLLSRALTGLPPDDRKLLTLRFADRRSQSETARRMGSSQVQVSRLERRILSRLRDELRDELEENK
ncbi:MAG: sigma-70 family RNA polymerase sigma factor [Oscillospiraceae bacterium]|nr:sigma-70 family RNA polymerase sigma factor [Oscillospiraceae bacterium]